MAKTKGQKKEIVKALQKKLADSKSVVFTSFNGLEVKENEDLRKKLKENSSEYCVAKKTLLDIVFKDFDDVSPKGFDGRVAAIFGYEDEVAPAKTIYDFKKELDEEEKGKINFLGGILEDRFIESEKVQELAQIPAREELYAKLVGSINAPVSGFVNVLAGNMRSLLYALKAIEEKKA